MTDALIHVYCMPGMAANPSIFEYIKLPENQFKIHFLEWKIPMQDEPLSLYAKRMCKDVKHDNPVLLGVSFGGILIQEMSKHINVRKLIVVSSVTTNNQLPRRMKFAKSTNAHKLLPTGLASSIKELEKYNFGKAIAKRLELYKKYMSVSDKYYLDWSIHQIVNWSQKERLPNVIQIHGDKDGVFTHSCDSDCHVLSNGTHIMIIDRYKWFNENLPSLILKDI